MHVTSLGYRTDLFFPLYDGIVTDRGNYVVVRTPSNPTFYWGNFLLFDQPPQPGDLARWRGVFAAEIGAPPEVEHLVFGWNGDAGDQTEFLEAGFRQNHAVVLTTHKPPSAPHRADFVDIRPLVADWEWRAAVESQVDSREPEFSADDYRLYREPAMARYRRMAADGLGHWYGAFVGDRLVADLGIFHRDGIGRYQAVSTRPDFRRRGIAGTLVAEAGRRALAEWGLHTLVIVADYDEAPARIYQSVGFRPTEEMYGLEWWPNIGVDAS